VLLLLLLLLLLLRKVAQCHGKGRARRVMLQLHSVTSR
jgi:hypothetical protein